MALTVDARGKACPMPVILAKQALEQSPAEEITVLVDNAVAVENLQRLAASRQQAVTVQENGGEFSVCFGAGGAVPAQEAAPVCRPAAGSRTSVFIGKAWVGAGDETLGRNLMKMFLYTLSQSEQLPASVLFMNSGVQLPTEGEEQVIESIRTLIERGCEVLVCGTCLNYYGLAEKLQAGTVSNMYEITERMQHADKVITV